MTGVSDASIRFMADRVTFIVNDTPFGGIDWNQKLGWEVRQCIVEGVEAAIERVVDE